LLYALSLIVHWAHPYTMTRNFGGKTDSHVTFRHKSWSPSKITSLAHKPSTTK